MFKGLEQLGFSKRFQSNDDCYVYFDGSDTLDSEHNYIFSRLPRRRKGYTCEESSTGDMLIGEKMPILKAIANIFQR